MEVIQSHFCGPITLDNFDSGPPPLFSTVIYMVIEYFIELI